MRFLVIVLLANVASFQEIEDTKNCTKLYEKKGSELDADTKNCTKLYEKEGCELDADCCYHEKGEKEKFKYRGPGYCLDFHGKNICVPAYRPDYYIAYNPRFKEVPRERTQTILDEYKALNNDSLPWTSCEMYAGDGQQCTDYRDCCTGRCIVFPNNTQVKCEIVPPTKSDKEYEVVLIEKWKKREKEMSDL